MEKTKRSTAKMKANAESVRARCLESLQAALDVGYHLRCALERIGECELVWTESGPIDLPEAFERHRRIMNTLLRSEAMLWKNTGILLTSITDPSIELTSESFTPKRT